MRHALKALPVAGLRVSAPAAAPARRVGSDRLQRDTSNDLGGQCFWTNNVCSEGRKKGIEAFKVSQEFANLVNGLFDSGEPLCFIRNPCDPRTGICTD
jgi:hypothetical protein